MENIEFDKLLFHKIYHGELTEEFESDFFNDFNISYKDFLQSQFTEHKKNTNKLAKSIGIKEKDLVLHLKRYHVIRTLNTNNWREFLSGNVFVLVLKAILAAIGTFPIFYLVGYLILYGYFFGQTDNALLDIVIKNIPLNRFSCYIAGFIFSGVVAYFISLYRLKGVGLPFLIFGFAYFLFASSISLSLILINANSSFAISEIFKIMLIWLIPIIVSLLLISIYYLANVVSKHYKVICAVTIICSVIPIFLTRTLGLVWSILFYLVAAIMISALIIKLMERYPILNNADNELRKKSDGFKFSLAEFFFFLLFVISLFIVIIIPMLCFILFSTGNYISSTLSLVGLTTNEEIRVKDTIINGKLVTEDEHYLYISTTSRTLLEISKDSSIQITKPNEHIIFSGESKKWKITIYVFLKDNDLWYSGTIKKLNLDQTKKLTYQLDNLNEITLIHSDLKSEYYIHDKLSPENFKKFTFVNLSWISPHGSIESEKVNLNISSNSN